MNKIKYSYINKIRMSWAYRVSRAANPFEWKWRRLAGNERTCGSLASRKSVSGSVLEAPPRRTNETATSSSDILRYEKNAARISLWHSSNAKKTADYTESLVWNEEPHYARNSSYFFISWLFNDIAPWKRLFVYFIIVCKNDSRAKGIL